MNDTLLAGMHLSVVCIQSMSVAQDTVPTYAEEKNRPTLR